MPVMMIHYQVRDEGVSEVERAVRTAFAALQAEKPKGIRFAYHRRSDAPEFFAVLELDPGIENPLPAIAAARDLQATVAKWVVGDPPMPAPFELLGAYGHNR